MLSRNFRKKNNGLFGIAAIDERVRNISAVVHRPSDYRPENPDNLEFYLAAVAIVKNEGPYLAEWVQFHKLTGIERLLLYDNESTDNTRTVLQPFIDEGFVELIPWPNFLVGANHQHLCYAHAIRYYTKRAHWLAIIDADEFLFSPETNDIKVILKEYEDLPALAVFWRCFGPSGHDTPPPGLVIENYIECMGNNNQNNQHYKSIVQPRLIHAVISAHRCHNIFNNISAYDENRKPLMSGMKRKHVSCRLRINHYTTHSLQELEEKIRRGYFGSPKSIEKKRAQYMKLLDCPETDRDILRFAGALRKIMKQAA